MLSSRLPSEETMPSDTLSYLALGDSYTIGESVTEKERYPSQLAQRFRQNGVIIEPTVIATTGWTTQNLQHAITEARIKGKKYDLVSLLIGVNNQYQGKNIEEYKVQFKELLLQAVEFAGGNTKKVFVVSIPDYGFTPFGESNQPSISRQIDLFNAANKQITEALGIQYFDITPISRKGLSNPALVAADGLHPSGLQYRQWTELMWPTVLKMAQLP